MMKIAMVAAVILTAACSTAQPQKARMDPEAMKAFCATLPAFQRQLAEAAAEAAAEATARKQDEIRCHDAELLSGIADPEMTLKEHEDYNRTIKYCLIRAQDRSFNRLSCGRDICPK